MVDRQTIKDSLKQLDARYKDLKTYVEMVQVYDEEYAKTAKEVADLEPLHEAFEEIIVLEDLSEQDSTYSIGYKTLLSKAYHDGEEVLNAYYQGADFTNQEECLVEIRPGVGGDEACGFCRDLTTMYYYYAKLKGWKIDDFDCDNSGKIGYKSANFKFRGVGCLAHMELEAGVHRIQRVPETEQKGRVHTSTVSVAVLPINEAVKRIAINDADIVIQVKHARGAGGQAVNKHSSAIRMLHVPTGLVVESDAERSQKQNIDICKEKLQAQIYQQQIEAQRNQEAETRSSQVGRAMRSEKFRTYNEPQHRITQHEDGSESFNYEKFFTGVELDNFHYNLNRYRKENDVKW